MMYTHLNSFFVIAVIVLFLFTVSKKIHTVAFLLTLLALLVLTAIFDHLIITAGIVGYDVTKLMGVYIGASPVEDFDYALAAGILMPTLSLLLYKKKGRKNAKRSS